VHNTKTEDDGVDGATLGLILGSIGGAFVVAIVIIAIIVIVALIAKRNRNSQASIYSDMIGTSPSYDPVHVQEESNPTSETKFLTPGLAEV